MVSWQQFEEEAPELARTAGDRFSDSGLVMLGTIRVDGSPRISPCEYTIFDGDFTPSCSTSNRPGSSFTPSPGSGFTGQKQRVAS